MTRGYHSCCDTTTRDTLRIVNRDHSRSPWLSVRSICFESLHFNMAIHFRDIRHALLPKSKGKQPCLKKSHTQKTPVEPFPKSVRSLQEEKINNAHAYTEGRHLNDRPYYFFEYEVYQPKSRHLPQLISAHPTRTDAEWYMREHLDNLAGAASEKWWLQESKNDLTWSVRRMSDQTSSVDEDGLKPPSVVVKGFDFRIIKIYATTEATAWSTRIARWKQVDKFQPMASMDEYRPEQEQTIISKLFSMLFKPNTNSIAQLFKVRKTHTKGSQKHETDSGSNVTSSSFLERFRWPSLSSTSSASALSLRSRHDSQKITMLSTDTSSIPEQISRPPAKNQFRQLQIDM